MYGHTTYLRHVSASKISLGCHLLHNSCMVCELVKYVYNKVRGRIVLQVVRSGEWYVIMVNGQTIGQLSSLLDASRLALSLLNDGQIDSVALPSGTIVK